MKRRDLILASASVAGSMFAGLGRAAQPCPPPQVSVAGGSTASTTCVTSPPGGSYSTNFNLTENPISEGGVWTNGGAVGLNWQNVRTTTGLAFGSGTSSSYNDCVAHLSGFSANQSAEATIFRQVGYISPDSHEVELLLRFAITSGNARGYEVTFSIGQTAAGIVRWNGASGDWTVVGSVNLLRAPVTGDRVKATIVGSTITLYQDIGSGYVNLGSVADSKWATGNPGIGFFIRPGSGADPSKYCYNSFSASSI